MVLSNLIPVIALVVILLTSSSHAFSTPSRTTFSVSTTAVGLFGNLFGDKKDASEKTEQEAEPKKPFIFSYGRPQYDWVKGKTTRINSGAVTWYTKNKDTKPPPKK
jgi:hypothetical protein